MAAFAEQAQCHILSEAAITMGLRILSPAVQQSFQVQTGLEHLHKDKTEKADSASASSSSSTTAGGFEFSFQGQAATDNRFTPGRPGAARGVVDLEIERHMLQHREAQKLVDPMVLQALKRGSPVQFAELKQRLADGVLSAQQAGAQLHKQAQFFDSQEKRGFKREGSGKRLWVELAVLAGLVLFFVTPVVIQQGFLDSMMAVLRPLLAVLRPAFAMLPSLPHAQDIGALMPFGIDVLRVVFVNVVIVIVLVLMVYSGLKN